MMETMPTPGPAEDSPPHDGAHAHPRPSGGLTPVMGPTSTQAQRRTHPCDRDHTHPRPSGGLTPAMAV